MNFLLKNDRILKPEQYQSTSVSSSAQKIINTFYLLNEDNQDILIGEAKKMLKSQQNEEKRKIPPMANAT